MAVLSILYVLLNVSNARIPNLRLVQLRKGQADSEKDYEDFTMADWRDLVENCLFTSQLRQTCDTVAGITIEGARRLRLSRFTEEIESILDGLISSLA